MTILWPFVTWKMVPKNAAVLFCPVKKRYILLMLCVFWSSFFIENISSHLYFIFFFFCSWFVDFNLGWFIKKRIDISGTLQGNVAGSADSACSPDQRGVLPAYWPSGWQGRAQGQKPARGGQQHRLCQAAGGQGKPGVGFFTGSLGWLVSWLIDDLVLSWLNINQPVSYLISQPLVGWAIE